MAKNAEIITNNFRNLVADTNPHNTEIQKISSCRNLQDKFQEPPPTHTNTPTHIMKMLKKIKKEKFWTNTYECESLSSSQWNQE